MWLPGVSGFNLACQAVGAPGDGVFTAAPVYPPFCQRRQYRKDAAAMSRCYSAKGWEWDWDAVRRLTPDTRLFMLCNPHNPVGVMFTRHELRRIADIAERHGLVICSDEIHCGLVFDESTPHLPVAALGRGRRQAHPSH